MWWHPSKKNEIGCSWQSWRFQLKRDYFGQLHLTYPPALSPLSLFPLLFFLISLDLFRPEAGWMSDGRAKLLWKYVSADLEISPLCFKIV